ncbi:MAG: lipoate--protein ligase family protein [Chloroflexi bacterium]|nr:lipoate--protein ligase family protein [Chloroflexota bacterium]
MSKKIRLLYMEGVSPLRSQTVYHAVGYAMKQDTPNTIILVSPNAPYVSIGYHQDMQKEVDLEYCAAHGLPVYRREVGGGAVYLDSGQLFTQWIFHKEDLPATLEERFALYIDPIVQTYKDLGINANYRPINDIHVNGKKIGGTGAAQMGIAEILVGSLMYTFDKKTMSQVLKVPSEKMRDKIFESLEAYMTTMTEQLGSTPDRAMVKDLYLKKVSEALGAEIYEGEWTAEEEAMAQEIDARFASDEWLYQKGRLQQPGVKIHQDVHLVEAAFKSQGGLIRVIARLREGRIDDVSISGDFTLLPVFAVGALEQSLRGVAATPETLKSKIEEAYYRLQIQSPGVTPADFTTAIMNAVTPPQPA